MPEGSSAAALIPIVDTSALMALHTVGLLPLLGRFYGHVFLPEAVSKELLAHRERGKDVPDPSVYPWLALQPTRHSPHVAAFGLDPGETAVISQAWAWQDRKVIAILDDGAARAAAGVLGVRHTGVVGLIIRWKELGWLPEVRSVLDELKAKGFFIDKGLRARALALSGEQEPGDAPK